MKLKLLFLVMFTGLMASIFNFNMALYPFTWLERNLGSLISRALYPNSEWTTCNTEIAAHRGFSNRGRYPDSSHSSIAAAIEQGVKAIEIDVTFVDDLIFLRHDNFSKEEIENPSLIRERYPQLMELQEFIDRYSSRFESITVDLKEINTTRERAFEAMARTQFGDFKKKFALIGMSCRLLRRLHHELGFSAGCESHGVIANWALGFDVWSVHVHSANELQVRINKSLGLKTLLWTFDTASEAQKYCQYLPDQVLVDFVFE